MQKTLFFLWILQIYWQNTTIRPAGIVPNRELETAGSLLLHMLSNSSGAVTMGPSVPAQHRRDVGYSRSFRQGSGTCSTANPQTISIVRQQISMLKKILQLDKYIDIRYIVPALLSEYLCK